VTGGLCGSELAKQYGCVSGAEYQDEYEAWRKAAMCARAYFWESKQSKYDVFNVTELGGS